MPYKPLRPCTAAGCPNRATQGSRCDLHARPRYEYPQGARPSPSTIGYDAVWRKVRAAYIAEHPDCVMCGAPAEHVDHIVALTDGGTHDEANLRSLCRRCHSRRHAKDGSRWRKRPPQGAGGVSNL